MQFLINAKGRIAMAIQLRNALFARDGYPKMRELNQVDVSLRACRIGGRGRDGLAVGCSTELESESKCGKSPAQRDQFIAAAP